MTGKKQGLRERLEAVLHSAQWSVRGVLLPFLCLSCALFLCVPLGAFGRRLPTKRPNGQMDHMGVWE